MKRPYLVGHLFVVVFLEITVECSFFKAHIARTESTNEEAIQKWVEMSYSLRGIAINLASVLIPKLNHTFEDAGLIGSDCHEALFKMLTDLKSLKLWAVEMLDATGFHPGGLISQTWTSYGNYEQCLGVTNGELNDAINGQYCLVDFQPALPPVMDIGYRPDFVPALKNFESEFELVKRMKDFGWEFYEKPLRFGVCLPSKCDVKDVELLANKVGQFVSFSALVKSCEISEPLKVDYHQKLLLWILATWIFATTVCSFLIALEYWNVPEWIRAMSVVNNFQRSLRLDYKINPATSHVEGMKVIAIIWVILIHQLLVAYQSFSFTNTSKLKVYSESVVTQLISNGLISVDVFFYITGFLFAYAKFKPSNVGVAKSKPGIASEILVPFLKRAFRTLTMCLLIIAITILLPLTGSGPQWKSTIERTAEKCLTSWWTILFFANNFIPFEDACAIQTWFICADIQFYLVFLIYCYVFARNRRVAIAFLMTIMLTSIVLFTVQSYLNQDPPSLILRNYSSQRIIAFMNKIHRGNQWHVPAYVIGVFIGTWLAKKPRIVLSLKTLFIGWILYFTVANGVIFITFLWNGVRVPGTIPTLLYIALARISFALSLAWVSLVCSTGHGGFVNSILSWKGFQWYNQLLFLVYLLNLPVIYYIYASTDVVLGLNYPILIGSMIQTLIMTSICAFLLHVIFEKPIIELSKIVKIMVKQFGNDTNNNLESKKE